MGWRKLGGDGRELCRSLEYVLESVQALKEAAQMGQTLDGEAVMKMDLRKIWCPKLLRSPASTPEDVKAALRRMKDTKETLAKLSTSLDITIQAVTDATIKDCQAEGFARLPDDVLVHIFEMYIDASVIPEYGELYIPPSNSPQVLSSVCKRFREIVHHVPNLWRHISLVYPKDLLRLHIERCANPSVHILPARDINHTRANMIDAIHPYTQWRELRLHFVNEDHAQHYFEHLQPLVKEPFHSLEYLSISNDLSEYTEEREGGGDFVTSIYLDEEHISFVSSWQMPKLTHLELRNFMPLMPLQCKNVTRLSIRLSDLYEDRYLKLSDFENLFEWMPKIDSLLIHFDTDVTFHAGDTPRAGGLPALPGLRYLDLGIESETPSNTIRRFMVLIDTQMLTHLAVKLRCGNLDMYLGGRARPVFEAWANALFTESSAGASTPFRRVEEFILDVVDLAGSSLPFEHIFTALPNVRDIYLKILQNSNIRIAEQWMEGGAFQHLRSLHIEVIAVEKTWYHNLPLGCHPLLNSGFDFLSNNRYCDKFEEMEVQNGAPCFSAKEKARLQDLFGERLHWVDC